MREYIIIYTRLLILIVPHISSPSHRFLRKMVDITIYDVKDNHISNEQVREELTCYKIHQSLELQRARWLEKLVHMNNNRGLKMHCVHGFITNQENKAVNNNTLELV